MAFMAPESSQKGAAIVTGSAQGIGRAIGLRLARDGYAVVFNDIDKQELALNETVEEAKAINGGRALAVVGDVSAETEVQNLVKEAAKAFGRLDVVRLSLLHS
jgi:NAD(P)-dependent dehydrogenase (short-subunit alcohol dehydrogenase family)